MVYNIVGVYGAPYYFSVSTGQNNYAVVTLQRSLIGDPFTSFDVSLFICKTL